MCSSKCILGGFVQRRYTASPMKSTPLSNTHAVEYAQRMNKVLDYIDQHLDTPLDLPTLAEVAHFSAFHFHRVFLAWVGETLGDYMWRRRLEIAAVHLAARSQATILEIALTVGFGSSEAFARAFKRRFGCTPSAWRAGTPQRWADELASTRLRHANRNLNQRHSKPDQAVAPGTSEDTGLNNLEFKMDMKVKKLPAVRVAYMRYTGPYGAGVNRFWMETFAPWCRANGLDGMGCYGIGLDDPGVTAAAKCRYDACVEVPANFVAKSPAGIADLPGGLYAVGNFVGTVPDISLAWTELLRNWLPSSGMQADARPCFEYYPPNAKYDPRTGVLECQICLPVRPL
jgi:AraC family transcriptional regulator